MGHEDRKRSAELTLVTQAGVAVDRALEAGHHDPEAPVLALGVLPECQQCRQSDPAVGRGEPKVPGRGRQVHP
jgi:hypothetical protein